MHDTTTGKTYIKLVNLLPVPVTTSLEMGDLAHAATAATSITLAGAWNDQQARPTAPASVNLAAPISLPAYSLTVITLIP